MGRKKGSKNKVKRYQVPVLIEIPPEFLNAVNNRTLGDMRTKVLSVDWENMKIVRKSWEEIENA